jgi:hypothetical protein
MIGLGHLLAAQVIGPSVQAGLARSTPKEPVAEAPVDAGRTLPWYLILNTPRDLDELWQKLDQPDLLVIKPDERGGAGPRNGLAGDRPLSSPAPAVIEGIIVKGRVGTEFAELTISVKVVVHATEPAWVPIRLDDQRVRRAREGTRELLLRMGPGKEWEVELQSAGEHRIAVDLRVALKTSAGRKSLALRISEAALTWVELDFADHESDVVVGTNEDFGLEDLGDGKPTRLSAHLSPRSSLEVSWAAGPDSASASAPLLTAQGEIAIEIDADQIRTRSSWYVRCVRGMTRSLEMRVDERDEPTELLVDDQTTEGASERKAGILTIRLGDVLRSGQGKRVIMKTRRPLAKHAGQRISFAGYPITAAREQTGFIGITQGPNLWVSPAASHGARQIDPRELPTDLRARPSTILAFEFVEQPFALELAVEPSPPFVKADRKTVFWIDSDRARSETSVDLQWVRGRLYDVELGVGPDVEVVSVGPLDVVENSSLSADGSIQAGTLARKLRIRLTASARDQNKITLKLQALQRIPSHGPVKLGLFTPDQATLAAASALVNAEDGLLVELDDESGRLRRSSERANDSSRAADRDWPPGGPSRTGSASRLLVSGTGDSKFLPVRIVRPAKTVTHATEIAARVTRRAIDAVQHTTVAVRYAALGSLQVRVPEMIGDRWELVDKEIALRRELGRDPDGSRRYGLTFDRPVLDKTTLQFRYRLPLFPGLDAREGREITLPWISVAEGSAGTTKVALSLATEISLQSSDPSWLRRFDGSATLAANKGSELTFIKENTDNAIHQFKFSALAWNAVPTPAVLAPRLLLKSTLTDEGLQHRAWYCVEAHGPDLAFSIPEGARWLGARVDGRFSEQVDYDPTRLRYRLPLPGDTGSQPVLVEIEYQTNGREYQSRLQPPQLLDGGVVLQTIWEVRAPGNDVVLGAPPGWFDENQWYWDGYVWKRGPAKSGATLREWLLGPASLTSVAGIDDFDESSTDAAQRSVSVFSRSGNPVTLTISIVPRSWMVASCSGVTLVLGFLVIFSRVQFRMIWLGLAVLGLLAAAFLQPSVLFLIIQSSFIGLALTLLGLLTERLVEQSRAIRLRARESSLLMVRPLPDSSLSPSPAVGSDDSTAIRVRVPSTADHFSTPEGGAPISAADEARSSAIERR